MASAIKGLSDYDPTKVPTAQGFKFALVVSEYHDDITLALRDGAIATLLQHGCPEDAIAVYYVPGAFELTGGAHMVAQTQQFDAILCLGCVIKGETSHDEYINHAVAEGLTRLSENLNLPILFGLLTPNTHQQAIDRAGGKHGNKGTEVAVAAIKMVNLKNDLRLIWH